MAVRRADRHLCAGCRDLHASVQFQLLSRTKSQAARAFSFSTQRRRKGQIPKFEETPSVELNDLLSTIRSKIFVPSHLRNSQQKLIYQRRHHDMLRNDPINVEVHGEEVHLEPIDRTKDVPHSWKSVLQAMNLMGTLQPDSKSDDTFSSKKQSQGKGRKPKADYDIPPGEVEDASTSRGAAPADSESLHTKWMQLLPLLNGMRAAGRKFRPWQHARVVRQAGEAGASHVVLFAAKQANATGLVLQDIRVVREVFWTYRLKALGGSLTRPPQLEWEVKRNWRQHTDALRNARRALYQAEQTANLLEDSHNWGEPPKPERLADPRDAPFIEQDPRKAAEIMGVMVEIAARWAETALLAGAQDEQVRESREYLEMYLDRLMANLKDAAYTVALPKKHDEKYRSWQMAQAATMENQEREEEEANEASGARELEETSASEEEKQQQNDKKDPTKSEDEHPFYKTNLKAAIADYELLKWTPVWHGLRLAIRILDQVSSETKPVPGRRRMTSPPDPVEAMKENHEDRLHRMQKLVDGIEFRLQIARDVVVKHDGGGWAGKMEEKRRGVRWFDEVSSALR